MSFGVGTSLDEMYYGSDPDTWGGPMGGVDLVTEAGVQVGNAKWHARMTSDLWSVVIILGALAGLWFLGGIVFRNVNIP